MQAGGRRFESALLHQLILDNNIKRNYKSRERKPLTVKEKIPGEGDWRQEQAKEGIWRMPRRRRLKKGVVSCEKPREAASKRQSEDTRMGKPG